MPNDVSQGRILRVLVTGGRDYRDAVYVCQRLDALRAGRTILFVMQGGCRTGADLFARAWAESRCVPLVTYFADWDQHKKAAGPIRNTAMADSFLDPNLVLAFPGGDGTADMVKKAEARGIRVIRCDEAPVDA